ncbi:hypothetical protein [Streptomyces sp. NPDC005407]|uniref:hypothetical protein n=1 Tax=Streptomyces sp. NPDC005407 TaxID=3155340 RepID=UPI0033AC91D8
MADIWVLGTRMHEDRSGPLVRADAITTSWPPPKLTASQIGSDDAITLVHKDSVGHGYPAPALPEDFHLALLAKLPEARKLARDSDEER